MNKRGSFFSDHLPAILLTLFVLVILGVAIFVLKGKGISIIDNFGNFFRGR